MILDESQLIKRARGGDADAFSQLAGRFERRVYTLALHYTRDRADADDLSQEVWLKAFRALSDFRGESSFYTWLRQIMVNTFLNHRRSEIARREEPAAADTEFGPEETPKFLLAQPAGRVEDEFQRNILVERVMGALGDLSPQQRLIFLLKHREGMTYEEIAKVMGCSAGTVKKALFRAVANLRRRLGVEPAPVELARCGSARGR